MPIFLRRLTTHLLLPFSLLSQSNLALAACSPLAVGAGKVLDEQVGTAVVPHFALERTDEKNYRALIDYQFVNEQGHSDPQLSARWEPKVRACLAKVSPHLKGLYGETLEIALQKDHPESVVKAPPYPIKIASIFFSRSNSKKWEAWADCAVILHESLHVLGLVDEYKETERTLLKSPRFNFNPKTAYNCRSLGPNNSIMAQHHAAFTAAGFGLWGKLNPKKRESLLYPAQFYAIIYPSCYDVNEIYYDCAYNAYMTSVDHGGGGCVETSALCKKTDWVQEVRLDALKSQ